MEDRISKIRILILSASNPNSYSNRRILEEIKKADEKDNMHDIVGEVVHPYDLYCLLGSKPGSSGGIFRYNSEYLQNFDIVIPRISGECFEYGLMILRQLHYVSGCFTVGSEFGLRICSNKWLNAQFLSFHTFPFPDQILAHRPRNYDEMIESVGGLPCVGKLQAGSLGKGVFLLNDKISSKTTLQAFEKLNADVIVQRFINSGSTASDIRAFVVGALGSAPEVFAYRRWSLVDDFRSNYSISKTGEPVELTAAEKKIAISVSAKLGLDVCGVDIMRDTKHDNEPYILECNGCPSLEGVETITGKNVAAAIIDYALKNYENSKRIDFRSNDMLERRIKFLTLKGVHTLNLQNIYEILRFMINNKINEKR